MTPLVYAAGRRIVVRNYIKHKDEIVAFCMKYGLGYDIRRDGSAVIICD